MRSKKMKSFVGYCAKCGNIVIKENDKKLSKEYVGFCKNCDENLYGIEIVNTNKNVEYAKEKLKSSKCISISKNVGDWDFDFCICLDCDISIDLRRFNGYFGLAIENLNGDIKQDVTEKDFNILYDLIKKSILKSYPKFKLYKYYYVCSSWFDKNKKLWKNDDIKQE